MLNYPYYLYNLSLQYSIKSDNILAVLGISIEDGDPLNMNLSIVFNDHRVLSFYYSFLELWVSFFPKRDRKI